MYERGLKRRLTLALFLGPALIGIGVFLLGPIVASFVLAFTSWDLLTPPRWAGLSNFTRLLADPEVRSALSHTLTFIVLYVPPVMLLGLVVAIALNRNVPGRGLLRAVYFLPVVTSWVAVALVWKWLLNPSYGLLNNLLAVVGVTGPAWLFDPRFAMPAVILTSLWKDVGFVMTILLAGLQNVPEELHEAAAIDGATEFQQTRFVTVPLLAPAIFFALTISLINSFQVFDQVYVMTGGGPAGATTVLIERIVKNAFSYNAMGYAAAMSWALFVLVFATSFVLTRLQRRWSW
ncbi:carbohydrate ABC transporter permease [Deinococcus yavapaiensis]|uniref:Carbohydrate ABC transporter membrane protein 1 (CUT1 family) n=1 Tax=Deinococcus yavapaiensis KR-236 TaxID=694435 RepID=A0A318SJG0_9DEIO|nr:sugar ABC transporter permease [Deinococcus yavapaiensis]PYE52698.1 carbohydrate ABC transporter membrane protein 1 (CUT1 family) [Deinococcus yavapaiensis KR-236]